MKTTKPAALLLVALMLAPAAMTSCGGDQDTSADTGNAGDSTTAVTAETEPMDVLEARRLVDDGVETVDFGGASFRIVTCDGKPTITGRKKKRVRLSMTRSSAAIPAWKSGST